MPSRLLASCSDGHKLDQTVERSGGDSTCMLGKKVRAYGSNERNSLGTEKNPVKNGELEGDSDHYDGVFDLCVQ